MFDFNLSCYEEIINLHCSLNIARMVKQRRMRWVEHVACVGEMRDEYNILIGRPEGIKY
jgi:hypothetical protein